MGVDTSIFEISLLSMVCWGGGKGVGWCDVRSISYPLIGIHIKFEPLTRPSTGCGQNEDVQLSELVLIFAT